jgi:hypothetical protein
MWGGHSCTPPLILYFLAENTKINVKGGGRKDPSHT